MRLRTRIGHRIFIISDEPYNRIVFDGSTFHTPAEFYPYTLIAYSYGKTLLSPGQRLGYLALPPSAAGSRSAARRRAALADGHDLDVPQRHHAIRVARPGAAIDRRRANCSAAATSWSMPD